MDAPKAKGLGDKVADLVHPVAVAIHWPCLDENGKVRPGSPCDKRTAWLNKIGARYGIRFKGSGTGT